MHPDDLLLKLQVREKISQADWKYGWPHKFYTDSYEKFYSIHLIDAGEHFDELARLLEQAGVSFKLVGGAIEYKALWRLGDYGEKL